MKQGERKIWFPAKRYGWGWGMPTCWQGWLVVMGYPLFMMAGLAPLLIYKHPVLGIGYVIALSIVLITVCWLKGEPPRWRWGGK